MANNSSATLVTPGRNSALEISAERVSDTTHIYSCYSVSPSESGWAVWMAVGVALNAIPGVALSRRDEGYELWVEVSDGANWDVVEAAISETVTTHGYPSAKIKKIALRSCSGAED